MIGEKFNAVDLRCVSRYYLLCDACISLLSSAGFCESANESYTHTHCIDIELHGLLVVGKCIS